MVSADGRFYKAHPSDPWTPIPTASGTLLIERPAKSRTAYVLLALFLGGLGIHNFYAGRIGCAVAQLLITLFTGWLIFPLLIVGIWAIVDAIAVDEDGTGRKFA